LRITVHDNPEALTFQLEGRLAGPWLRELDPKQANAEGVSDWFLVAA